MQYNVEAIVVSSLSLEPQFQLLLICPPNGPVLFC